MCEKCKKKQEEEKCENICKPDDLRLTIDEFLPMVRDGLKFVFDELAENEPDLFPILSKACSKSRFNFDDGLLADFAKNWETCAFKTSGIEKKREGNQYRILVDLGDFKPEDFTIEVNREARTLTIEAKHEVSESNEPGSARFSSNTMKYVETIPSDIDIFGLRKEFVGKQLVISGYVEEGGKCENIVKL